MYKDRRADAVLFGFDFQVNAAIVLMLEKIKELGKTNEIWLDQSFWSSHSAVDNDSKYLIYI
jgi:hypothetical protein